MHIKSGKNFIKPYTASSSHKVKVPAVGKYQYSLALLVVCCAKMSSAGIAHVVFGCCLCLEPCLY